MAYRLLNRTKSSFGHHALYAEQDHLLCVQGSYTEIYRRFFYKDLQAILIRKTYAGLLMNVALSLLAVFFAVSGTTYDDWVLVTVNWIVAGLFLIPLIVNLWQGPTCECRFQTTVQFERIEALRRLQKVRRIVREIISEIESAQGPFNEHETLQRALDLNFSVSTSDTSPPDLPAHVPEAES